MFEGHGKVKGRKEGYFKSITHINSRHSLVFNYEGHDDIVRTKVQRLSKSVFWLIKLQSYVRTIIGSHLGKLEKKKIDAPSSCLFCYGCKLKYIYTVLVVHFSQEAVVRPARHPDTRTSYDILNHVPRDSAHSVALIYADGESPELLPQKAVAAEGEKKPRSHMKRDVDILSNR